MTDKKKIYDRELCLRRYQYEVQEKEREADPKRLQRSSFKVFAGFYEYESVMPEQFERL